MLAYDLACMISSAESFIAFSAPSTRWHGGALHLLLHERVVVVPTYNCGSSMHHSPKHMGHLVSSLSLASCTFTMLQVVQEERVSTQQRGGWPPCPLGTAGTTGSACLLLGDSPDKAGHSPAGLQPLVYAVELGILLDLPVQSVVNKGRRILRGPALIPAHNAMISKNRISIGSRGCGSDGGTDTAEE